MQHEQGEGTRFSTSTPKAHGQVRDVSILVYDHIGGFLHARTRSGHSALEALSPAFADDPLSHVPLHVMSWMHMGFACDTWVGCLDKVTDNITLMPGGNKPDVVGRMYSYNITVLHHGTSWNLSEPVAVLFYLM